jgi:hypothetical protein
MRRAARGRCGCSRHVTAKLRQAGYSLHGIADETSLGLNTVRTIVAQQKSASS